MESTGDLACGNNFDMLADIHPGKDVVHEVQPVEQGSAHIIGEFLRRCTGSAFSTVNSDEIGVNIRPCHGLTTTDELTFVSDTEFKSYRLAVRKFPELLNEMHQSLGCAECFMVGW